VAESLPLFKCGSATCFAHTFVFYVYPAYRQNPLKINPLIKPSFVTYINFRYKAGHLLANEEKMFLTLDKDKNSRVIFLALERSRYLTVNSTTFVFPSFISKEA
jgi:hypothetical protein